MSCLHSRSLTLMLYSQFRIHWYLVADLLLLAWQIGLISNTVTLSKPTRRSSPVCFRWTSAFILVAAWGLHTEFLYRSVDLRFCSSCGHTMWSYAPLCAPSHLYCVLPSPNVRPMNLLPTPPATGPLHSPSSEVNGHADWLRLRPSTASFQLGCWPPLYGVRMITIHELDWLCGFRIHYSHVCRVDLLLVLEECVRMCLGVVCLERASQVEI